MTTHIFYHAPDLDGRGSGVILSRRFPDARVKAHNYFYDFKSDEIKPGDSVIFADVFLTNPEHIERLAKITKDITVIDHHNRAKEFMLLESFGVQPKGIINTKAPGAISLVWDWCYQGVPVPLWAQYIGTYDCWKRNFENVRFSLAANSFNTYVFYKPFWDKIVSEDKSFMLKLMTEGDIILRYVRQRDSRYIRAYSRTGYIDGHRCIVVNVGMTDSSIFDSIPSSSYEIYVRATLASDGTWKVSITTNNESLDLTTIAAKFDGGGHEHACGLKVNKLEDLIVFDQTPDRSVIGKYYKDAFDHIDGLSHYQI